MKKTILLIISIFLIIGLVICLKPEEYQLKQQTINNLENLKERIETIEIEQTNGTSVFLVPTTSANEEEVTTSEEETTEPQSKELYQAESENSKENTQEEVQKNSSSSTETQEENSMLEGIYKIQIKSHYLTLNNTEIIATETEGEDQEWQLTKAEDGYYEISSVQNDQFVLQEEKGTLTVASKETTNKYDWELVQKKQGIQIKSIKSQQCLTLEDNTWKLETCEETNATQLVQFQKSISNFLPTATYKIASYETKKYLTKAKDSKIEEQLTLSENNNEKTQVWYVTNVENNLYTITTSVNPNLFLSNESLQVQLNTYQDTDNQQWQIDLEEDTITIKNSSDLCLTQEEENLEIQKCNQSDSQKFILEEYTDELIYYGIDISSHQGNINWQEVSSSDVEFVIIRAGYGDNWTTQDDEQLIGNVKGCEQYHIPYGIYLYSYAKNLEGDTTIGSNSESTSSEIAHIMRILEILESLGYHPNLKTTVFYDMEEDSTISLGKDTLTQMADKFCHAVETSGYSCGIYANKYWLTSNLDATYLQAKYTIWLAEWPSGITSFADVQKTSPSYDQTYYNIWQFSSKGTIPGISGYVDLDIGYHIFD